MKRSGGVAYQHGQVELQVELVDIKGQRQAATAAAAQFQRQRFLADVVGVSVDGSSQVWRRVVLHQDAVSDVEPEVLARFLYPADHFPRQALLHERRLQRTVELDGDQTI